MDPIRAVSLDWTAPRLPSLPQALNNTKAEALIIERVDDSLRRLLQEHGIVDDRLSQCSAGVYRREDLSVISGGQSKGNPYFDDRRRRAFLPRVRSALLFAGYAYHEKLHGISHHARREQYDGELILRSISRVGLHAKTADETQQILTRSYFCQLNEAIVSGHTEAFVQSLYGDPVLNEPETSQMKILNLFKNGIYAMEREQLNFVQSLLHDADPMLEPALVLRSMTDTMLTGDSQKLAHLVEGALGHGAFKAVAQWNLPELFNLLTTKYRKQRARVTATC